jgi:hypothetical protein
MAPNSTPRCCYYGSGTIGASRLRGKEECRAKESDQPTMQGNNEAIGRRPCIELSDLKVIGAVVDRRRVNYNWQQADILRAGLLEFGFHSRSGRKHSHLPAMTLALHAVVTR